MRVKLTVNLGHADARRYGVASRLSGDVVDVSDRYASEMIARCLAVEFATDESSAVVGSTRPAPSAVMPSGKLVASRHSLVRTKV